MPIPVVVVGGYLGAGKTTLINAVLRESRDPVAVLVNDFGSIGIDAGLIVNRSGETIELANGCVCCSLSGGMAVALESLANRTPAPKWILIEASGVSNPAKVAQFAKMPGFVLDGIVVVADAENVRLRERDRLIGKEVRVQIACADLIVLNKVDLVDDLTRAQVRAWLAGIAPGAAIVETERGSVPPSILTRATRSPASPEVLETGDGGHLDRYESWTFERDAPLERAALDAFLSQLPPNLLRAKGIVRIVGEPQTAFEVHVVGKRVSIERAAQRGGAASPSRIVFIATAGDAFSPACVALARRFF